IPEPCFLHDALARVERLGLAPDLELEGMLDVAERIEVLDLDLRPERRAPARPDRDVRVAAERALLHVAVADAEEDQDGPEGSEVGGCLFGRRELGPRHGLHERDARAVEVDQARLRGLERAFVQELADVLLEVQALDPDRADAAVDVDLEGAVLRHRLLALADPKG